MSEQDAETTRGLLDKLAARIPATENAEREYDALVARVETLEGVHARLRKAAERVMIEAAVTDKCVMSGAYEDLRAALSAGDGEPG